MCGIAGIWSRENLKDAHRDALDSAVGCIGHRGPDARATHQSEKAALGHARLSIIDTSSRSNQPMTDPTGRYTLVFNGEIYNFKKLGAELSRKYGTTFQTTGDTEVLLYGLIHDGAEFISGLNGFFAFALYDHAEHSMLAARDRYGIKPFYHAETSNQWMFGSTLSAVTALGASKKINHQSLTTFLSLNYIPAPATIFSGVKKLMPGHFLFVSDEGIKEEVYYTLPQKTLDKVPDFEEATKHFKKHLENSVEARLLADVPVGTFLSGGLDSSVISLIANRMRPGMPAFSIGFPDQPFFDESPYAREIARHIGAKHHILEIREKEIDEKLNGILDAIDEPFADSSAVLVNLLSEYARHNVKVALSGDGADELLGGYNKHQALLRSLGKGMVNRAMKTSAGALHYLPASRSHKTFDQLRKAQKYSRGLRLTFPERYWAWARFTQKQDVEALLLPDMTDFNRLPNLDSVVNGLNENDFNSVLRADFGLVLPNDMLHKVDLMSMHRALEVRVPFLDHRLVDFCFGLPANYKIDRKGGKKLLRKAFENEFPEGTFDRNKRGFEAPLGHWLGGVLSPLLDKVIDPKFITEQKIFNVSALQALRQKVKSRNPSDSPHTLWAVLVFQHWWLRNFGK